MRASEGEERAESLRTGSSEASGGSRRKWQRGGANNGKGRLRGGLRKRGKKLCKKRTTGLAIEEDKAAEGGGNTNTTTATGKGSMETAENSVRRKEVAKRGWNLDRGKGGTRGKGSMRGQDRGESFGGRARTTTRKRGTAGEKNLGEEGRRKLRRRNLEGISLRSHRSLR